MIEFGEGQESSERRAAITIRDALLDLWPDLQKSEQDRVYISAGCKIFGYEIQDFDVVICGLFRSHRLLQPLRPVRCQSEDVVARRNIAVRSFVVAVEVKSHDPRFVRFEGATASVRYRSGWHDASNQSQKQAHSLRAYLAHITGGSLFVTNLIMFDGLEEGDLPRRPHNLLPARFSGRALMTAIAEVARPWVPEGGGNPTISGGKQQVIEAAFAAPAFKPLEPSQIDRRRMDRISRRRGLNEEWYSELGQKQLVLRGRGGTGKTVGILQLANRAFEERGARTLILTYNLALLADIRRVMSLLRLPGTLDGGGVLVESVMSHIGKLLNAFGMLTQESDLVAQYERATSQLAELLKSNAFPLVEIENLLAGDPVKFSFDYVMIDEGQDWPKAEIEILRGCYRPNMFVVADGVDQLVRGTRAAWTEGVTEAAQRVWQLKSCLRLKRNIAIFANALARRLGLEDWSVEPLDEVRGGRVIVLAGRLSENPGLHRRVIAEAISAGNSLIDVLYCAPPSLAGNAGIPSPISTWLKSQGIPTWDGTRYSVRVDIPRSIDEARIIQYESCRGLEGWSVVCMGLPEFWQRRKAIAFSNAEAGERGYSSSTEQASLAAARWVMIAATRAMDTLLIELSDCPEDLLRVFRALRDEIPDVVEWIG